MWGWAPPEPVDETSPGCAKNALITAVVISLSSIVMLSDLGVSAVSFTGSSGRYTAAKTFQKTSKDSSNENVSLNTAWTLAGDLLKRYAHERRIVFLWCLDPQTRCLS